MADAVIRPLALCVCIEGGRVLLQAGFDRSLRQHFWRAIGGGIEFGERAEDAARREYREELGVEPTQLELLGVLENLFTYEGREGHEIAFLFRGVFPGDPLARAPRLELVESDGQRSSAHWIELRELCTGTLPLYPNGALHLCLAAQQRRA